MCSGRILEAVDGITYLTDLEGTITAVGTRNWNAFAAANDALELNDQSVVGHNLFEFVRGRPSNAAENSVADDCGGYSKSLHHAVSLRRPRSHQEYASVDNPNSRRWGMRRIPVSVN